jgi:hypothetical protein
MARLVGGKLDGRVMLVPIDQFGDPWSPVGWPAVEIPWRPLLVYEVECRNVDGTWTFRYRGAHYNGW